MSLATPYNLSLQDADFALTEKKLLLLLLYITAQSDTMLYTITIIAQQLLTSLQQKQCPTMHLTKSEATYICTRCLDIPLYHFTEQKTGNPRFFLLPKNASLAACQFSQFRSQMDQIKIRCSSDVA